MFNPSVIYLLLWVSVSLCHFLFNGIFFELASETYLVISLSVVSFLCAGGIISHLKATKGLVEYELLPDKFYRSFTFLFSTVYVVLFVFVLLKLKTMSGGMGLGSTTLSGVRDILINDFRGERELYVFIRFFFVGVFFSIFSLSLSKFLSKKLILGVFLIGLMSAVMTTGRLSLLVFFVASSALLYRNNIIRLRHVLLFGGGFVALFFLLAIAFEKGTEGRTVTEALYWNIQVYFMSSIACLNNFIVTGSQNVDGGVLLPNVIRNIISTIGAIEYPLKPSLNPFSFVPLPCNTYTVLYPLLHDGGAVMVILIMFLLGGGHQYLYKLYKAGNSPVACYFFSLSLYPLLMTIFEDAYFSSPGFWATTLLPILLFWLFYFYKMKVRFVK